MNIFSKIDKEVLTILVILFVVILFAGIMFFRYMSGEYYIKVQNNLGGAQTEQNY